MATQSHLRELNRRKVVEAMLRLRTATRGDLAQATHLSPPTVGRIADGLLAEHFLAEVVPAATPSIQLGRPSRLLELDRAKRRFLAIELGVEQTRLAALPVGVGDSDLWDEQFPTPRTAPAWARALAAAVSHLPATQFQSVILSIPGVVDEPQGQVILCPNIRWAEKADFAAILRDIDHAPLIVIQEIRALALGQLLSLPREEDFLLVDVGSGVGAAAVVKGQLYRGSLALSGELGHIPILGNSRPCGCGALGCVETLVSRSGLLTSARQHQTAHTWSTLAKHLRTHALPPWLCASLDALAMAIISALNTLGLRQVFLSGILDELSPAVTPYVAHAVCKGALWGRFGEVQCRSIPHRRTAGMVLAAIQRSEYRL